MLSVENEIWSKGYNNIACIDEVGRGCLAGDVVACAIIMPRGLIIDGVNDSKKISEKKREKLYDIILDKAIAIGIGSVDSKIIDEINIKRATHLAMKKAIQNLKNKNGNTIKPDHLLIDAEKLDTETPQLNIIKGDSTCHGIAAASIVAKVWRDRKCIEWDKTYNGYQIDRHKGYGTKAHREAIKTHGPSEIHRITFLRNILKEK